MRRSGFTMIELIFVIVILGILASVAIPKLAATRDDAKIAGCSQDIATFVSDISSYYVSQGSFSATLSDMSNVPVTQTTAPTTSGSAGTFTYSCNVATTPVVSFTLARANNEVTLTTVSPTVTDTTDLSLQARLATKNMSASGTGVSRVVSGKKVVW